MWENEIGRNNTNAIHLNARAPKFLRNIMKQSAQ